ncbi:MAG: FtsX-like permease family protein, partial [Gemmatimonadaceae bacterium]|nr:FtsX-like permease family protein [Chitinophagaceae bacterium]
TGFNMQNWYVDHDYIATLTMEIVKGRNFSRDFGSDSTAMVINESAAAILGYADPIGKKIYTNLGGNKTVSYDIIGVVKNFNFESLRQKISPLGLTLGQNADIASFKISTANVSSLISQIENKWKTMSPMTPFSYRFLDEAFDNMYRDEQRVATIAISFAVLAIFIACLGLLGLVTFAAEQRTKEIGIRKVLGASSGNIVGMLSKDFLRLVLVAGVIAIPFSWWAMKSWLEDFAFRIDIKWWMFLTAMAAAILIALLTIFFQAIKAAIVNPIRSLRSE